MKRKAKIFILPLLLAACGDAVEYAESWEHNSLDVWSKTHAGAVRKARARIFDLGYDIREGKIYNPPAYTGTWYVNVESGFFDHNEEKIQAEILWHEATHCFQFNEMGRWMAIDADEMHKEWHWAIEVEAYRQTMIVDFALGGGKYEPERVMDVLWDQLRNPPDSRFFYIGVDILTEDHETLKEIFKPIE